VDRLCRALPTIAVLLAATACGGTSARSPSMIPTAPTAPAVTSLAITSVPVSASSLQLAALAHFSDGTSKDITTTARWESTNTNAAVVSVTGLVSAVAGGDVDIHATYQSTMATTHVQLARPDGPSTFVLSGVVHEVSPNARALGNVRIAIMAGPDFGTTIASDSAGAFRFTRLSRGVISVEASKDGYVIWKISNWLLDRDRQLEIALFPVPPQNGDGVTATARCLDGSWTWEKHAMLACADSGLAYVVCPGPLCGPSSIE
jgi:Big-like domain-containing protein